MEERAVEALEQADQRDHPAAGRRQPLNEVFAAHGSCMLGENALYSFIIVILSGVYLALFFVPSMEEVVYNVPYDPLRGVHMSRSYESALALTFEVRGGLFMRQLHHWSALLFVASMLCHMFRVFFTGAFRKPR
ncbi:hypothetical protein [Microbacterium sp. HSID17254]|uniref:hypothetical protein n=1 Tax=Microbacterium sp. HSID17254 TaxID=2419509 RepID=UPI00193113AD|nr:hypothetical protein [Microbacterium sp. HSID17254]